MCLEARGENMSYRYKVQNEEIDKLFEAILSLKDKQECYRFFDDLCTINEMEAFGQRLEVAKMLFSKMTYQEIEKRTGISAATISKISKSFSFGPGGYEMVINRLKNEE
jgi:TrpR-related protein YerC/YecD